LLLALLRKTLGGAVSVRMLDEELGYLSDRLRSGLEVLRRDGLISLDGEQVTMNGEQRVRMAARAIASGSDPEVVSKALDWREFEGLSVLALRSAGYSTRTRFRFVSSGRRREIDILALSEPRILCLDCKHWRRAWQRSATERFVGAQIERVEALSRELPGLVTKTGVSRWRQAQLLPVLLTLSDTPYRVCNRVPVVSVFRLRGFLWDLPEYVDGLFTCKVSLEATGLSGRN
jgi:hypothetical protein